MYSRRISGFVRNGRNNIDLKQKEDFKMNKKTKTSLAEWLDDRKNIMKSFNNPADKVFYNGAIEALVRAGFEIIEKNGKHTIL